MKNIQKKLSKYIRKNIIVEINRDSLSDSSILGYVVGVGKELIMLHQVNNNALILNGYVIIRMEDISSYFVNTGFLARALKVLNQKPVIPANIDISNWQNLFKSLEKYPNFVCIQREKIRPNRSYIGEIVKCKPKSVSIDLVDYSAVRRFVKRLRCINITRVDIDSGYLTALTKLVAFEEDKVSTEAS